MNERNEEILNNFKDLEKNPESVFFTDSKGHKYYETNRKIYTTMDYDLFKKLQGNRAVEPKRIVKITHSLELIGWMPSVVIVNEKFEVIDGQGRLESLKALKLPVEFVVCKDATIKECTTMNINSTNWNLTDYVYRYAEDETSVNNASYKKLRQLIESYPRFPVGVFGSALRGVPLDARTIKENRVYITDEMYAKAIPQLDFLNEMLESITTTIPIHGGIKNYLLCGTLFCYNLPEIDRSRLKISIINGVSIPKNAVWMDIPTAIAFIENCYNKGLSASKKIYMETEYRKSMDLRKSEGAKWGIQRKEAEKKQKARG